MDRHTPRASDHWLDERLAEVPSQLRTALLEWLHTPDGHAGLAESGVRALRRAGGRPERSAAHDLLVADALITYACERAAVEPDPEAALDSILDSILQVAT
jgi:hypothetical protein